METVTKRMHLEHVQDIGIYQEFVILHPCSSSKPLCLSLLQACGAALGCDVFMGPHGLTCGNCSASTRKCPYRRGGRAGLVFSQ